MKKKESAFVHHGLSVHSKAMAFHQFAVSCCKQWDSRHAVVDELKRAADSVVTTLSIGVNQRSPSGQVPNLDYALGSGAECGACLDISLVKQLGPEAEILEGKRKIHEVFCMVHGLRRAWLPGDGSLREESPAGNYGGPVFAHETLDAYKRAMEIVVCLDKCDRETPLPPSIWRELDRAATAIPLNLAEGNARFSKLDQARFFELALQGATRIETRVSTCVNKGDIHNDLTLELKHTLNRTAKLIRGLMRYVNKARIQHSKPQR